MPSPFELMSPRFLVVLSLLSCAGGFSSSQSDSPDAIMEISSPPVDDIANLQRQADLGDAQSQYELSRVYFSGRGLPRDAKRAIFWMKASAERGHLPAAMLLAAWHRVGGDFIPEDKVESLKWYILASDQDKGPRLQRIIYEFKASLAESEIEEAYNRAAQVRQLQRGN